MIVGVSGAVSSGKTTLSLNFAKKHNYYYISLKKLAEKNSLLKEYDVESKSYVVDVGELAKCYDEEIELIKMKHKNIIVESHLLVEQKFVLDKLILLRVSPLTLYYRMLERGYSKEKAYNNALSEALDYFPITALKHYPYNMIYEINLTKKTKNESLEELEKAIMGKIEKKNYSFPKELEKLALMKL